MLGVGHDPRGGTPAGRLEQTFVAPEGVRTLTDATVPRTAHPDVGRAIYRGGTRLTGAVVARGTDWEQATVDVPDAGVQPGETLRLVLENPASPTGIGFWQAHTTGDAYPRGGLTATNPCRWAQSAHPAVDAGSLDLVARVGALAG